MCTGGFAREKSGRCALQLSMGTCLAVSLLSVSSACRMQFCGCARQCGGQRTLVKPCANGCPQVELAFAHMSAASRSKGPEASIQSDTLRTMQSDVAQLTLEALLSPMEVASSVPPESHSLPASSGTAHEEADGKAATVPVAKCDITIMYRHWAATHAAATARLWEFEVRGQPMQKSLGSCPMQPMHFQGMRGTSCCRVLSSATLHTHE